MASMDEFKEAGLYWLEKLSGELKATKLHTDSIRLKPYVHKKAQFNFTLEKEPTLKLIQASRDNMLSLYIILLSAFKALINKYTGEEDMIITSPVYSPTNLKHNKYVFFRDKIRTEMTFGELLGNVKTTVVEGYKNEHYPMNQLLERLGYGDELSLFHLVFIMAGLHQENLIDDIPMEYENDMILVARKNEAELEFITTYNASLFNQDTIRCLMERYNRVLIQVMENISIPLSDIDLMPEDERNKVLFAFNKTEVDRPNDKTIIDLFAEQVESHPFHTALVIDDEHMTYRFLHERSDALAYFLKNKGIKENDLAALMMNSSVEMAICILAVIKAGGVYLPVDPTYPPARIKLLFQSSNAPFLLATPLEFEQHKDLLASLISLNMIVISDKFIDSLPALHIELPHIPHRLAYAIFTSGTTGVPKGVLIEQRGLINYTLWRIHSYRLNHRDVTLQPLSYCFDGFGSNFYSSLLSGGTLVFVPDQKRMDFDFIGSLIRLKSITNVSLVPQMYFALLDNSRHTRLNTLRFVVLAGEKSGADLIKLSTEKAPHILLYNEYGPTEATVTASGYDGISETATTIIGTPIANTHIYMVDKNLKPVPPGISGELCIAGPGVSPGYLNSVDLTHKAFIENWFITGERLYRTGDLAKWHPNGIIEILGRSDQQVKIRGFRIELHEIEAQLLKFESIKQSVVIERQDDKGEKNLCAYIVPRPSYSIDIASLREDLINVLPFYMVPAHFIPVENIPLTPSGKINQAALPSPKILTDANIPYAAPRSEVEKKLAGFWADTLGFEPEKIGIDDDFFRLGGHSLKATVVASKIHKALDVQVPVTDIFMFATIRRLADNIKQKMTAKYNSIEIVPQKEYYEVSSAQKRLFVLNIIEGERSISYNIPTIIAVKGKVDPARMEDTFMKLINRHEALRTSFLLKGDKPAQVICPIEQVQFNMKYDQCPEMEAREKCRRFVRPFDLSKAPLFRVELIKIDEAYHILMIDIHHIIADGTSVALLVKEFGILYRGGGLPPLRIQYKDFSEWQNRLFDAGWVKTQEDYWLDHFKNNPAVLNLPTDYPRPTYRSNEGKIYYFSLSTGLTGKINELTLHTGTTLYMVLLAAYNILLAKLAMQDEIIVGTPITGRNHADLEYVIGTFANMLAMKNFPHEHKPFEDFLHEVKKNALSAYENQDYQFEELIRQLNLKLDPGRNPLFDVVLNVGNIDMGGNNLTTSVLPGEANGSGWRIERVDMDFNSAKYDLLLRVFESHGKLDMSLEYSTDIFKESTVEIISKQFRDVLEQVVENRTVKIKDISIYHQLILNRHQEMGDVDFNF